jgi:SAM-dependent methyltransferase
MARKTAALFALCALALLLSPAAATAQDFSWDQYKHYDVPFVPTPHAVVEEMLRLGGVKSGDMLYDLGCGDGRIVVTAAQRYGIRAVGIDIDPVRIAESEKNAKEAGVTDKVKFIEMDLFQADFRDATVITMYLLTSVNRRLRPRLLAELRPGTRLVSHSFDMGDWQPDDKGIVALSESDDRYIYFWRVPANVTGRWTWELPGSGKHTFDTEQKFQVLSGTVSAGSDKSPVSDVVLEGARIEFKASGEINGERALWHYQGVVDGERIKGTVRKADAARAQAIPWTANRVLGTSKPLDTPSETGYRP